MKALLFFLSGWGIKILVIKGIKILHNFEITSDSLHHALVYLAIAIFLISIYKRVIVPATLASLKFTKSLIISSKQFNN